MESMAVWVGGWPSSTKEKSDVVALLAEKGVAGAEVTEFRRKVYSDSRHSGEGGNEDESKRKRKRESSFAFAVLRFESGRHDSARKVLEGLGLGLKVRDLKGKLGRKRKRKRKGGSDGRDGSEGGIQAQHTPARGVNAPYRKL